MQNKTKMRFHYKPLKRLKFKKTFEKIIVNAGEDVKQLEL